MNKTQEKLVENIIDSRNDFDRYNYIKRLGSDDDKIKIIKEVENNEIRVMVAQTIRDKITKLPEVIELFQDERDLVKIIKHVYSLDTKLELIKYIKESKNIAEILNYTNALTDERAFKELKDRNIQLELNDLISLVRTYKSARKLAEENNLTQDQLISLGTRINSKREQYDWLIQETNIRQRIQEIDNKQYKSEPIDLPEELKFGVELEFEGLTYGIIREIIDLTNAEKIKDLLVYKPKFRDYKNWNVTNDLSLNNGAEFVSPILNSSSESMEQLELIYDLIHNIGQRKEETCGGHIHFSADYLGKDLKSWENLFTIWREAEELFYKISNKAGEVPREEVIDYAEKQSNNFDAINDDGSINIETEKDFKELVDKLGDDKFYGINLSNLLPYSMKNTIEFRIPNVAEDIETQKENILLYGKLMEVSKKLTKDKNLQEKFELFKSHDLTEAEKLESLLDLLFEKEESKKIYRERWESVKDKGIFEFFKSKNETYKRNNYSISTDKLYNETIKEQNETQFKIKVQKEMESQEEQEKIKNENMQQ